jgi:hypothetical protein
MQLLLLLILMIPLYGQQLEDTVARWHSYGRNRTRGYLALVSASLILTASISSTAAGIFSSFLAFSGCSLEPAVDVVDVAVAFFAPDAGFGFAPLDIFGAARVVVVVVVGLVAGFDVGFAAVTVALGGILSRTPTTHKTHRQQR